jgi:DNA-binding response OmpR family regulator
VSGAPHSPTILIVDDEDYVADMIGTALEIEGYTTYVAYNGRDGLELARQITADTVIIDVMMPYLNGPDLIAELRELDQWRNVPVILISAGARPRRDLPNVIFVAKPFDLNELLQLAARLTGWENDHES